MHVPLATIHSRHFGWDRSIEPNIEMESGSELAFEVIDASGGQIGPNMPHSALASLDFARVNPVTGPVFVRGARPGDVLEVEARTVGTWTSKTSCAALVSCCLSGSMVRCFRLLTHAAQGDGEVCGTAIECPMTLGLSFTVRKDRALSEPEYMLPPQAVAPSDAVGYHVTTGIADDLREAARKATRHMLDFLETRYGYSRQEAYALASVAVDLRISEVVDVPNWVVSAFLPLSLFAA